MNSFVPANTVFVGGIALDGFDLLVIVFLVRLFTFLILSICFAFLVLLPIRLFPEFLLMIIEQPRLVLVETYKVEVQVLYAIVIQNILRSYQLT